MANYQQLIDDVMSYLNRRDCAGLIPSWVVSTETEIAETVRARCMVTSVVQNIDAPYIALPADFATMADIRDNTTGELLTLLDAWDGHWTETYARNVYPFGYTGAYYQLVPDAPVCAYRLMGDCLEWLPHPNIPDPPDPAWVPQSVQMGYYQRPRPLLLGTDTNPVLDNHYEIYLYGVVKRGAIWALDDERAAQMDASFQQVSTRASLWKQMSDYSGAPLRSMMACRF